MDGYFADVSDSSKKLYKANLKRLNGGTMPKSITFLKKTDEIKDKLMLFKPNTRRTYIVPILKIFKDYKVKKYYEFYTKLLEELNTDNPTTNIKTEKEAADWVSDDLIQAIEQRFKENPDTMLLEHLVFSLYTRIPPRRSLDFVDVRVCEPVEGVLTNFYYNKKFYFNNYKTAGTYGTQIVEVPDELDEIIQKWMAINPTGVLLPNWSATRNTRIMNKLFGQGISVNAIRRAYATKHHAQPMKDLEDTANAMANSPATLVKHYIKYDEPV
jgi:hypothetical protein